jgi:hypothetical protein
MEASFTILFLLFILATTVFWIWALVDVLRRPSESLQRGSQLLWALVIAITHSVGAATYLLFGRAREAGIASVGR